MKNRAWSRNLVLGLMCYFLLKNNTRKLFLIPKNISVDTHDTHIMIFFKFHIFIGKMGVAIFGILPKILKLQFSDFPLRKFCPTFDMFPSTPNSIRNNHKTFCCNFFGVSWYIAPSINPVAIM